MLKTILSIAVIIVSAGILFLRFVGLPPRIDARPHIGIGEALAEQAAKLVGSGGKITLIAPDNSVHRHPGAEVQLKIFFKALRRANLTVSATNLIKLDPLRLVRVPPDDFVNLLRKQSEADVIVSLLGPPIPTPEQKGRLPAKHGRVVAVCSGDMPRQVNLKSLFEDNLLHAAIVSRTSPAISLPPTDDPQLWFQHFYQTITPANLGDLPAPQAATP
jgi:hypothetical protein